MTSYVYKLTFPNGKIYIGKADDPRRRFLAHKGHVRNGKAGLLYNAWRKHGAPGMTILDECNSPEEAFSREVVRIAEFSSNDPDVGYNSTRGGDGLFALSTEAVVKRNRNAAIAAKIRWADPKHREAAAERNRNAFHTEDGRKRRSIASKAHKAKPEVKKAYSERMKKIVADPRFKAELKKRMRDPAEQAKRQAAQKAKFEELKKDPMWRVRRSVHCSTAAAKRYGYAYCDINTREVVGVFIES